MGQGQHRDKPFHECPVDYSVHTGLHELLASRTLAPRLNYQGGEGLVGPPPSIGGLGCAAKPDTIASGSWLRKKREEEFFSFYLFACDPHPTLRLHLAQLHSQARHDQRWYDCG